MKIKSITKIDYNECRYDIQVSENHNFFANGILVHNCSMYNDYIHARSINSGMNETRKWLKNLWSQICHLIDDNMIICGENLYAKHSIQYNNLSTYFMVFSVWIDNICLSWDETVEYSKILGLEHVPVIYDGIYDKDLIIKEFEKYKNENEGYVIRIADEFTYADFRNSIGKFVRPEFRQVLNQNHSNWLHKKIEINNLKK